MASGAIRYFFCVALRTEDLADPVLSTFNGKYRKNPVCSNIGKEEDRRLTPGGTR